MLIGSEGIFGIITEAIIKLRYLPEVREYNSIIFHNFEAGINFMYEVAMSKVWPASIRTVDNEQFIFGRSLQIKNDSTFH